MENLGCKKRKSSGKHIMRRRSKKRKAEQRSLFNVDEARREGKNTSNYDGEQRNASAIEMGQNQFRCRRLGSSEQVWGVVIHDSLGRFSAAHSVHVPKLVDLGEALAARESCKFAEELGFEHIVLGDSTQEVQLIQRQMEEHNTLSVVLADIDRVRPALTESLVQFIRRDGNEVAHCLEQNSVRGSHSYTWEFIPP
ncbi:hypothetical protein RHMOL_Rhmol05G0315600 [Rhododendron molle]|uniref:Uncharacterized protein n=1 Tax=Rhododendron molle TaxID=49168 RepID=A0ACC0NX58_RHOML|nr:hypothetical protein RHMOL_Rhmol05G0315600 [Rhododendron molle]